VRFVVDRVALGQVFLLSLLFPPVISIPPGLHTHIHLHAALTEGQTGDAWESSNINVVSEIGEHWVENYFDAISDGLERHFGQIVPFLKICTLLSVKLSVVTLIKACL